MARWHSRFEGKLLMSTMAVFIGLGSIQAAPKPAPPKRPTQSALLLKRQSAAAAAHAQEEQTAKHQQALAQRQKSAQALLRRRPTAPESTQKPPPQSFMFDPFDFSESASGTQAPSPATNETPSE